MPFVVVTVVVCLMYTIPRYTLVYSAYSVYIIIYSITIIYSSYNKDPKGRCTTGLDYCGRLKYINVVCIFLYTHIRFTNTIYLCIGIQYYIYYTPSPASFHNVYIIIIQVRLLQQSICFYIEHTYILHVVCAEFCLYLVSGKLCI